MTNHQTRYNLITNIVTLCFSVIVGLYYTPYLVRNLGLVQYGVLPLSLIVTQYISLLTGILTHSYTRFYSVALRKEDYESASRNISTSFLVVISLVFVILLISFPIISYVDGIFTIPNNFIDDAKLLFGYTILSFCISLFSSLLNVTLYAQNRLDIMNYIKIARSFANFGFVILFFNICAVKVSYVGLSGLLSETLVLLISIILFHKSKPRQVKIHIKYYDRSTLVAILTMSVWVLIQQCGDTLLYRTDNLIINIFFDLKKTGALGAISELCGYIRTAVSVFGSLFGPLILIAYSNDNHKDVQKLAYGQSFIVGVLAAIMAGLISGFGNILLKTWISNEMAEYYIWLWFKMLVVPFYAAGAVLSFVYRAWNRVKKPALWTVIIGIIDIISVLLFLNCYKGLYAIEIMLFMSSVFSVLQCYILNIICVNLLYPGNSSRTIWAGTKILSVFIFSGLIGWLFTNNVVIESLSQVAVWLILLGIVELIIVYFFIFNNEERNLLLSVFK